MKELIRCGNEPDHQVQLQVCRVSLTCLNVTCTNENIHHCDAYWENSFISLFSITLNYRPGTDNAKCVPQIQQHTLPLEVIYYSKT